MCPPLCPVANLALFRTVLQIYAKKEGVTLLPFNETQPVFREFRSETLVICHLTELFEHLGKIGLHGLIRKLACSDSLVTAAVIFEHKRSDIHIACTVKDAVSDRCRATRSALAVNDPCGNILSG